MTILVTGAAGFLGQALCRALVARSDAVRATTRRLPAGAGDLPVDWQVLDLADHQDWTSLLDGVTTVYHMAWSSIPASAAADPLADLAQNVGSLLRLLEAARARGGVRIIFPSSGGTIYGRTDLLPIKEDHPKGPISAYGIAKQTAEAYLDLYRNAHGVDSVALRIGNPYGASQDPARGLGAVTHFARAALSGGTLTLFGDGLTVRDFVHIDDVVAALLAAGDRREVHGPINIGAGQGHCLLDVIAALEAELGRALPVVHLPARPFDVPACVLDISKAREQLRWAPRLSFECGLKRLLRELSDN